MNIHKNARLTPQGRLLLVERITEAGWSVAQAAQAAGISVRQSYRWLARYRAAGAAGLGDRSSAPHRCRHRTADDRVSEIERLRRQRMSGPQIARQLGMSVSTVGEVLRRLGLNRLAALDEKPAVLRYERERPGELIHLDTKKLGRIEGVGHRITGRRPGAVNRLGGIARLHRRRHAPGLQRDPAGREEGERDRVSRPRTGLARQSGDQRRAGHDR